MQTLITIPLPSPVTITLPANQRSSSRPHTLTRLQCHVLTNNVTKHIHAQLPPIPNPLLLYRSDDFADAATDTIEQHGERILHILGHDPTAALQALADGSALPAVPPRVPREIANWRAKAVLAQMGKLSAVEAALAALPEPQKTVVSLAWKGDAKIDRKSSMLESLALILGLSQSELDDLFIRAASIKI
jgi:hypothetical protein